MGYFTDLSSLSIEDYKNKLISAYLIPSRMILRENLKEHFSFFKSIGIKNVQELQQILKKKGKIQEFSKENGLSEEYLTILLREINSIQPKPNKIREFVGISQDLVSRLEKIGIKDTVSLFERVRNSADREKLAVETGASLTEILELTKLTDLSRIKWVGATFARMLYEAGYDTAEKVSKADYTDLYNKITKLNNERNLYKGKIGLNDMRLCVEVAADVTPEIIF